MKNSIVTSLVLIALASGVAFAQAVPATKTSAPSAEERENRMQKAMREACENDTEACKKWRKSSRERREEQRAEQLSKNPVAAVEPVTGKPATAK